MSHFFRDLTIKAKLTLIIMFASVVLLVIIGTFVLVAEIYTTWTMQRQQLQILSQSIASSCRQLLVLDNHRDIDKLLESLVNQENIHAAYVFDANGIPVADFLPLRNYRFVLRTLQEDFLPHHSSLWTAETTVHHFASVDHFSLFTPIFYEGERIGTLYLLSDLQRLYGRLSGVAFAISLSLLALILLSWRLAGYLQKPVSAPLLQLTQTVDDISRTQDYSARAVKQSDDEIGRLVDGFNRMLLQIETHQSALAEHQQHLERKIAERTADLRRVVADLELARKQADAANEAKSKFLSRMTHELRTPLIGVLGMNELLARTALSNQQQVLVDTVQKSGEQLLQLIGDVLDFSRIEAGKLHLDVTEFDLSQMVHKGVELLQPQAQEKGLALHVTIAPAAVCRVLADETRLRQILMNLIGNAIKFTSSGSVQLDLDCQQVVADSGSFVFTVTDTGLGMADDIRSQVFDSFYQAEGTSTENIRGTGLGLAIVKDLVELMNGDIELTSTPGEGTCFRVRLDLPLVAAATIAEGGNR